ncbi:MAG: branched-chain amino acid ABC transporter ATP-binding protein/permease [Acidimicrobiales bacterium]
MFSNLKRDLVFPTIGSGLLFAMLVGGGLLYSSFGATSRADLVTALLVNAIMVVGIQIFIGNTGILSFGHVGFGAIAGYAFAVLAIAPARKSTVIRNAPWNLNEVQLSPVMAGLVAVVVSLLVAVLIGFGLARSGAASGAVAATVITLALLEVTHELAINWTDLTGGDRAGLSFRIGQTIESRWPIYLALFGAILIARLFAQSKTGLLAQAGREDNLAARAMGINPTVQQMVALLVSVAIVAVAASLRVYQIGNITPNFFFLEYTLLTLVMLIVGGRNSVTGALLGAVIITIGSEFTRYLAGPSVSIPGTDWILRDGLSRIFLGAAMVGFMIFRSSGLVNDWELDQWLYRKTQSGRETAPSLPEVPEPPAPIRLVVEDVTVDFGGFRALTSVGITASSDEIIGLIGPNGAGKTTLVNVITGMVQPTEGKYFLGDKQLDGAPPRMIARSGLVRTFQNLRLFSSLTVRQNVEVSWTVAESHHLEKANLSVDEIIRQSGLWELRHRRASELDYGNSRRLELARAAALRPRFLLLDEPTSGMSDAESDRMIEQVRATARSVGAGVLVIDHDLNFITGISDRIYVLDQGRVIAEGTPGEVQADPQVQAAYLGSAAATD